jgi:hypothetical protein
MSIVPLSPEDVWAHDQRVADRGTSLLLIDAREPHGLAVRRNRTWVRMAAKLLSPYLDPQIAEGLSPDSNLLRAARAQVLVSSAHRRVLAQNLIEVLRVARRPPSIRSPQAPLNRTAVVASATALQEIIDTLLASRPLSAHGIAIVGQLLCDGTSPLYRRQYGAGLEVPLREAIERMN